MANDVYITVMKNVMRYLFLLVLVSVAWSVQAQDVQFSQFYTAAQYLNPALTGNFDGKYRIMSIYRDQNRGALEQPFVSYGFGGDVKFSVGPQQLKDNNLFGVGVFFYADKAPTFEMNTNAISVNLAYHKRLSRLASDYISVGLQFGVQQRNINYDNLNFGDEFNQVDQFDRGTQETLPPNNYGFSDLGLGVAYSSKPTDKASVQLGVNYSHITTPTLSFFSQASNNPPSLQTDFTLEGKVTAHASLDYQFRELVSVLPRLVYIQQGEYKQVNVGTYLKFDIVSTTTAFYTGLWLRGVKDYDKFNLAYVVPTVGLSIGDFSLGLSYDVNIAKTLSGVAGLNSFEFSIRFLGSFENDNYFCPEF